MITKLLTKLRRRKLIACTSLAVIWIFVLTILHSDLSPDLYFIHWGPLENTSCHYMENEDTLPRADGKYFKPPSKSIFFHETSCKGDLNPRQACAVESAARAHPDWQINVLFAAPVTNFAMNTGSISVLRNITNIKLSRVHIEKYAKGTPLEPLVSGGALKRTRWRISHSSDVLRYLSLYKFGGVYLDLDVVVAKPFDSLVRNWAARETNTSVAAGALAFSRDEVGREVAEAAIRDINSKFRGDVWGNNGPGVITRLLGERCAGVAPSAMSVATCKGFEVYGPQFFYPIGWWKADVYFKPGEIDEETPYVFHVWNKLTSDLKVHKDSPYSRIARKYCPDIYKYNAVEFGL